MAIKERSNFASMLDDLLAEQEPADSAPRLATTLDYLSVADELAGNISIAEDEARATYRDAESEIADLFLATPPRPEPLPSCDPDSVALELGISARMKADELDRIRREFALKNHPDRVAEHLRDCSITRMQIANMLIDEAKKKLARAAA